MNYSERAMREAAITVNGTRLTDTQAEVMRIAVETFAVVLAEGIEAKDEGITRALHERYFEAMAVVQKLLYSDQTRTQ
jgi:hypothetical protein